MASGLTGNEVPLDRGCGFDSRALRLFLVSRRDAETLSRKDLKKRSLKKPLRYLVFLASLREIPLITL